MDRQETFRYTYVHLMPEQQIGLHDQDSWELSYVIKGSGMRLIGNTTMPFENGDLVLIPPKIPHCWYFNGKEVDNRGRIANISLMFTENLLTSLHSTFADLRESIDEIMECKNAIAFSKSTSLKIQQILLKMSDMDPRERIASVIKLLIMIADDKGEVVGRYIKVDKAQKKMDIIKTYIICNVRRNITLDEISTHVGMNKSAFCSFFKRMTGMTFVEYLNEYSIEMACRLIKEGEMSITEICYQTGFNDVPYFSRLFKRIKGVSPSRYSKVCANSGKNI